MAIPLLRGVRGVLSPVEPKMQDLQMRFHSPNGTMEPSEEKGRINYTARWAKAQRTFC